MVAVAFKPCHYPHLFVDRSAVLNRKNAGRVALMNFVRWEDWNVRSKMEAGGYEFPLLPKEERARERSAYDARPDPAHDRSRLRKTPHPSPLPALPGRGRRALQSRLHTVFNRSDLAPKKCG